jgi:hypothetical protein
MGKIIIFLYLMIGKINNLPSVGLEQQIYGVKCRIYLQCSQMLSIFYRILPMGNKMTSCDKYRARPEATSGVL